MRGNQTGGTIEVVRTASLYGRSAVLGITSADAIYGARTEAIDLRCCDLSGRQEQTFNADSRPPPVTSREIEFALADASEPRRRALAGVQHAQAKPAFHTVIIDDSIRIWTGRYTRDPERHERWVTLESGRGEFAIVIFQAVSSCRSLGTTCIRRLRRCGGAPTAIRFRVAIR